MNVAFLLPAISLIVFAQDVADTRETFQAEAFLGLSIDTFSAQEMLGVLYQNPQDNGAQRERMVGGFKLNYGLAPRLWIYAESRHGARSAELISSKETPGQQLVHLLRNASSLESHLGLRFEFLTLNAGRRDPARVYLKAQAGFLSIAQGGGDIFDAHRIALGLVATAGRYEGSFLEAGYGRSDVFRLNRYRRVLVAGHLTWGERGMRPFVSMTVDGDAGIGADSVQTTFGVTFDVGRIF